MSEAQVELRPIELRLRNNRCVHDARFQGSLEGAHSKVPISDRIKRKVEIWWIGGRTYAHPNAYRFGLEKAGPT